MSTANLTDLLGFEEWANYVSSLSAFTNDADIISAFDYTNISQITVGEYLSLLDVAEFALLAFDWDGLVNQMRTLLNDPLLAGQFTEAQKQLILEGLAELDISDITEGFDYIRAEFAGMSPDTVLYDALMGNFGSSGGSSGSDVLTGTAGDDVVNLMDGNDVFWAGANDQGDDSVSGGDGNDTIAGGAGNDTLDGGSGHDVAFGGAGQDLLDMGSGSDFAWAGAGDDTVYGGAGNDVIGGGDGADALYGNGGDDVIYAGSDNAADTVDGGAGDDTIFGGGGDDVLDGGAGDDVLFNASGADTVSGGDGEDVLWGGAGDDRLSGGADADLFAFASGNGHDTISDFDASEGDEIDIQLLGYANFAAVVADMSETAAGVVLEVSASQSITFEGLSIADLQAAEDSFEI